MYLVSVTSTRWTVQVQTSLRLFSRCTRCSALTLLPSSSQSALRRLSRDVWILLRCRLTTGTTRQWVLSILRKRFLLTCLQSARSIAIRFSSHVLRLTMLSWRSISTILLLSLRMRSMLQYARVLSLCRCSQSSAVHRSRTRAYRQCSMLSYVTSLLHSTTL